MNIADIITEWGAVYRAEGQGIQDLMIKLMQKSETEALFPVRITEKTILEKAVAEFSRVLQRFQKGFTPIGTTTFTPTKIPLWKQKIDVSEYPDDLEESWLGFLADSALDRRQWPFVTWWLTNLLSKAAEDLEKDEIFWGVPGTITAGTATAAKTNMLGIRKQINDAITATDIAPVVMGAVPTTASDVVAYIETFWKSIPELIRSQMDVLVMRPGIRDLFREGMRAKYNMNYAQVGSLLTIIDTNVQVVGVESHTGSDKMWATPSWNRQRGLKKPANETFFEVEKVDRQVKAYTDFYKGVGFWIPQYVYTNDQDLT